MDSTEIKLEFKKRKTRQLLIGLLLIPSIFVIAFLSETETELIAGISNMSVIVGAGAVFITGIIFSFINWRCPNCKTYLGKRFNPKFCSDCGTELR